MPLYNALFEVYRYKCLNVDDDIKIIWGVRKLTLQIDKQTKQDNQDKWADI